MYVVLTTSVSGSCAIGTMLRYFGYDPWNIPCIKSARVELGHRSRTQSPTAREGSLALLDAITGLIPTFLLSPCHRLAT